MNGLCFPALATYGVIPYFILCSKCECIFLKRTPLFVSFLSFNLATQSHTNLGTFRNLRLQVKMVLVGEKKVTKLG